MSVKGKQGTDPTKSATVHPPKETTVIAVNLDQKSGAANVRK